LQHGVGSQIPAEREWIRRKHRGKKKGTCSPGKLRMADEGELLRVNRALSWGTLVKRRGGGGRRMERKGGSQKERASLRGTGRLVVELRRGVGGYRKKKSMGIPI